MRSLATIRRGAKTSMIAFGVGACLLIIMLMMQRYSSSYSELSFAFYILATAAMMCSALAYFIVALCESVTQQREELDKLRKQMEEIINKVGPGLYGVLPKS